MTKLTEQIKRSGENNLWTYTDEYGYVHKINHDGIISLLISTQIVLLKVLKEEVGEMNRKFVTEPRVYKGSDANVWREGFNSAISQVIDLIDNVIKENI